MNRLTTLLLCAGMAALPGMSASAAVLTPEQALARAASTQSSPRLHAMATSPSAKLVYTAKAKSEAACYVFDINGHGLVLSADDAAMPVLGYSDEIIGANGEIAPALEYWLECLSAQIESARNEGTRTVLRVTPRSRKVEIPPMVTTRWNQNSPYNMLCPMTAQGRSVTGCVATSMSQAMRYHNYPLEGIGTHSYSWNGTTLTFDYANTEFDWTNMLDVYTSSATEQENIAVATLMYAAGVSVNMNYSALMSGAYSLSIPAALIDNFGYDKGTHYESRSWYSPTDWEDLVYDQLKYGPIIYGGSSNDGGHSFICDGYDGEGLYHFNWGWGGVSDGYYTLNALDPMQQGIGGSSGGYDFLQDIIAGIRTPQPGSEYYFTMAAQREVTASLSGRRMTINGSFFNFGNTTLPLLHIGLSIEGKSGEEVIYVGRIADLAINSGFGSFYADIPATLEDGIYTVKPVYSTQLDKNYMPDLDDIEWQPLVIPYEFPQEFYLTVDGSNLSVTSSQAPTVKVVDMKQVTPVFAGQPFSIQYTLSNDTDFDFCSPLALAFFATTGEAAYLTNSELISVPAHQTVDVTQNTVIAYALKGQTSIETGQYLVGVVQGTPAFGYTILEYDMILPVEIEEPQALAYTVDNLRPTTGTTDHMNPDELSFSADVTVTSGIFNQTLLLGIFRDGEYTSHAVFQSKNMLIGAGETKTATFEGNLPDFIDGEQFFCAVFTPYYEQVTAPLYFTVGIQTGIDGVEAINDAEYYDLRGLRVDASALVNGTPYIVVKRDAKGNSTRNKMIYRK